MVMIMDDYSDDSHLHAEARRESFSVYTDFGKDGSFEVEWDQLPALVYLANELKEYAIKQGKWAGPVQKSVAVPLEMAELISNVFMPKNPNKMRQPHPDVKAAVIEFRELLRQ